MSIKLFCFSTKEVKDKLRRFIVLFKKKKIAIPDSVDDKVLFVSFRDGKIRISQNTVLEPYSSGQRKLYSSKKRD